MNNFNINLTVSIPLGVIVVSTIFRVLAARDFWFVVKKAREETGTKNGLEILRKQLLASSVILLFINTAGLMILFIKPVVDARVVAVITSLLTVINSVLFWVEGKIRRQIYTQQYTPQQKKMHEQFANTETRRLLQKAAREAGVSRAKKEVV